VSDDELLVELCREDAGALCHHELAFAVAKPDAQVLGALKRLRSAGLVLCLELDLEAYGASDTDGRWVPVGDLEKVRHLAGRSPRASVCPEERG
jgi:hypothetical protein